MTLTISTDALVNVLQRRAFALKQQATALYASTQPTALQYAATLGIIAAAFDGLAEDLKLASS